MSIHIYAVYIHTYGNSLVLADLLILLPSDVIYCYSKQYYYVRLVLLLLLYIIVLDLLYIYIQAYMDSTYLYVRVARKQ